MKKILTHHAKRRMRQRGVSSSRVLKAAGKGRYQGGGVYRSEVERHGITYVVVYKLVDGKKIILSTWRKETRKSRA